jgi:hypothetical protein
MLNSSKVCRYSALIRDSSSRGVSWQPNDKKIRNFDETTLREVKQRLRECGLHLGMK